jgi:hypothetical protein
MTAPTRTPAATVLGELLAALQQACAYNRNDQEPPAVLFWTDAERQWEPLLPRLRSVLPHLLALGPYDPATRTGPAIWLRCLLVRVLPGFAYWPLEAVPVLYLPGVSRQQLRAVDECPAELQPLAGLQYRGVFWSHSNGKDWTVSAFLQSERGGLGLDVARDGATQEALRTALVELADVEVSRLAGKQLSAEDFEKLLEPDPVRSLLQWLNAPVATREQWDKGRWKAFRGICRKGYDFDPETDGELAGAERLGRREKKWAAVWQRFAESPDLYPHLPERLRAARPRNAGLFDRSESWPQDNEQLEADLREDLLKLPTLKPADARATVYQLEAKHGPRQGWVWARLRQAPLAVAVRSLHALAAATEKPLNAATVEALAEAYTAGGWKADAAVLAALAAVKTPEDVAAVRAAVKALYEPWLADTAACFQNLVADSLPHPRHGAKRHAVPKGTCLLFADGLRYDVGQQLRAALAGRGLAVEAGWHWVALPPVTPTAKPALSPVADLLCGSASGEGFYPNVAESGRKLTPERFVQLLEGRGWQVLKGEATGSPDGLAWTECGKLDRKGHDEGWWLAHRIGDEVQALADRIQALLKAGWKEVRVVTDHGWLLLPGGLPKIELPSFLADDRWGRCALLREGAKVELPQRTWHWSEAVWVVMAPGIGCFVAGKEYAHGSLSLQECLVPRLTVTAAAAAVPASVTSAKWTGLRCKVTVEGAADGMKVDLRTKIADPASSLAVPKSLGADGTASLFVEDDGAEGTAAFVVLLDAAGSVIAKFATAVGGGE